MSAIPVAERRPIVNKTTSDKAGHCTCCGGQGTVYEINLSGWISRVCLRCANLLRAALR